jgi:hypothetical protein
MAGIFKNELSEEQLNGLFQSDEKCFEFLAELKWSDGFVCRKCRNGTPARKKRRIRGGVQNARRRNQLLRELSFITVNFP